MKLISYLLFLILALISCQVEDARIALFNNNLPKKDKEALDELVDLYHQIISENYKGVDKPNQSLLDDVVKQNTQFWKYEKENLCKVLSKFDDSTLDIKSIRQNYDTVYAGPSLTSSLGDTMIITVTQEKDTSEHIEVLFGDNSWEALIEKTKKDGYWKLINESSFVNALKHEQNPKEIQSYIDSKEAIGGWHYINMAESMRVDSTIDFEDYFMKRIVVFEIFYRYLREKYRC